MSVGLLHCFAAECTNKLGLEFGYILFTSLSFMQQSLFVTAGHDPVAGFPLTPKKCLSSDDVDVELGSSQISPAQLSSKKLTRHSDKSEFSWFHIILVVCSRCCYNIVELSQQLCSFAYDYLWQFLWHFFTPCWCFGHLKIHFFGFMLYCLLILYIFVFYILLVLKLTMTYF